MLEEFLEIGDLSHLNVVSKARDIKVSGILLISKSVQSLDVMK